MFLALFSILWGCDDKTNNGDDSAATDDTSTPPPALPTHWETLPSMENPRNGLGCVAIGDDVYAIAGYGSASDPFRRDLEVLSGDAWIAKTDMSTARDYFLTAPRADGSFVVIGGFSKSMANAVLHYDPGADAWDSAGSIASRLFPSGGAISGDRVVLAGGAYDYKSGVADTTIIDFSSGDVTDVAPAPSGFSWAASATIGDKLYVSGGTTGVFTFGNRDDLLVYDAASDAWTELAPLPGGPIDGHAMVALEDHLFVIGGYTETGDVLDAVWRYDIATDTWEAADSLPAPVTEACAVAVGDHIVVMGGLRKAGTPIAEAVAYVP